MAAPSTDNHFVLDMATCSAALGKVEMQKRTGKKTMPAGWGVDSEGRQTVIPDEVLTDGGLSPLGGAEETGKYIGVICTNMPILSTCQKGLSLFLEV